MLLAQSSAGEMECSILPGTFIPMECSYISRGTNLELCLREGSNPWALFSCGKWNGSRCAGTFVLVSPLSFSESEQFLHFLSFLAGCVFSTQSFFISSSMWLTGMGRTGFLFQHSTAEWHMNMITFIFGFIQNVSLSPSHFFLLKLWIWNNKNITVEVWLLPFKVFPFLFFYMTIFF